MKKKIFSTLFFPLIIFFAFTDNAIGQEKIPPEWVTYFEKSGFIGTPSYQESIEYFTKFTRHSKFAKIAEFGTSPQGRKLWHLTVSASGDFSAEALKKSPKPLLFILNGIHSGEIEGKDATMLLLREILVTGEKSSWLEGVNIVIVPIFSVDGHERKSKYNRINQNGPEEMGWRTTAQNLNLNRDWMKADAPEMQAMLRLISSLNPDFLIDNHTTNGADYQYTVTYGLEKFKNLHDSLAWSVTNSLIPYMERYVEDQGFLIAPYVGFRGETPESGLVDWAGSPRFSTGYTAIQNRIGLLVETHMMKPYKDRVYSTKSIMEAVITWLLKSETRIKKLNKIADESSVRDFNVNGRYFPVAFRNTNDSVMFTYKGIEVKEEESIISGAKKNVYTGEPYTIQIPFFNHSLPADSVTAPYAYIIPREWSEIAERLKLHGVEVQTILREKETEVTKYKFHDFKFSSAPFEGRQSVTTKYHTYTELVKIPEGSFIVYTNQRTIRVILTALEPKSGDSYLRWGFMNSIFERKEYFEDYVMERVALEMYYQDKAIAEEFNKRLREDQKFREDKSARLNWFYEHSPYFDKQYLVYPIMRVEKEIEN
ncbi:MAG: M14 family metallopeptidase [Ignavibacteriaceae bacterium]|nr:M14 family metallopeptidase [Ignavibacteriaceae bacterium]